MCWKQKKGTILRAGLAATTVVAAAAAGGLSASAATKGSANAMPDLSYFSGKTITWIAPDKPGGDYDLYARAIAPGLGQILHATVNVENNAGAGTIAGTNQLWASAPNGLTIGGVAVGGDAASLVEHQPGQNFNLRKFSWIGQPGNSPDVLLVQPSYAIKTFKELLHLKSPMTIIDTRNGVGDMLDRVIFGAFHIPVKFLTGYTSVSSQKQGFLAGEGDALIENEPPFLSLLQANQARPLLLSATPPRTPQDLGAAVKGVPVLPTVMATSHLKLTKAQSAAVTEALSLAGLSYDVAAPPGMSKAMLQTLRTAFEEALKLASVKAQAAKEGEPLQYISGLQLNKDVATALEQAKLIGPYVNLGS